jgi:hypothetical protein
VHPPTPCNLAKATCTSIDVACVSRGIGMGGGEGNLPVASRSRPPIHPHSYPCCCCCRCHHHGSCLLLLHRCCCCCCGSCLLCHRHHCRCGSLLLLVDVTGRCSHPHPPLFTAQRRLALNPSDVHPPSFVARRRVCVCTRCHLWRVRARWRCMAHGRLVRARLTSHPLSVWGWGRDLPITDVLVT